MQDVRATYACIIGKFSALDAERQRLHEVFVFLAGSRVGQGKRARSRRSLTAVCRQVDRRIGAS